MAQRNSFRCKQKLSSLLLFVHMCSYAVNRQLSATFLFQAGVHCMGLALLTFQLLYLLDCKLKPRSLRLNSTASRNACRKHIQHNLHVPLQYHSENGLHSISFWDLLSNSMCSEACTSFSQEFQHLHHLRVLSW